LSYIAITRGVKISQSPKIKIRLPSDYPMEDLYELEEAQRLLNFESGMIMVDGERVGSYEELVKLVGQDKYKDREFIEVVGILPIAGG
jgi:hypothetical protein